MIAAEQKTRSQKSAEWNRNNRDRYNYNWRRFYSRNAESRRLRERSRSCSKYGISLEQYDLILKQQDGKCAICLREERSKNKADGVVKALAIDHNHITGVVRGLLCSSCNRGISKLGENPMILRRAADYLENGLYVGGKIGSSPGGAKHEMLNPVPSGSGAGSDVSQGDARR